MYNVFYGRQKYIPTHKGHITIIIMNGLSLFAVDTRTIIHKNSITKMKSVRLQNGMMLFCLTITVLTYKRWESNKANNISI